MPRAESTVLLPVDRAALCIPPINPPELVTKHRDGELIKFTQPWRYSTCDVQRRHEHDSTWTDTSTVTLTEAISSVATMQSFGLRYNNTPIRPGDLTTIYPDDFIELEPLDNGGIVVETDAHLPLVLHRRDNTFWRLRSLPDRTGDADTTVSGTIVEYGYVIEQSDIADHPDDEHSTHEWEHVTGVYPDHSAADAAVTFASKVGIPYVSAPATSDAIDEKLSTLVFCFGDAATDETDAQYRDQFGLPKHTILFTEDLRDTVFSPDVYW